jgi:aminopeptidase-like protein
MVNDDLTGVAGLVELSKKLINKKNHYTYRLFLLPETIGSIAFLSQNEDFIDKVKCGIFFEMLGTNADLILQHSKQKNTTIDKISSSIFKNNLTTYKELPFIGEMANDEQVWNGPGVNIPMISIGRGHYPENHTSNDMPEIVSYSNITQSIEITLKILETLDKEHVPEQLTNKPTDEKVKEQKKYDKIIGDYIPKRLFKGPVFLSGYGLFLNKKYNSYNNLSDDAYKVRLIFNYFEGDKSVFEISKILNWDFKKTLSWTDKFLEKGLIEKIEIK